MKERIFNTSAERAFVFTLSDPSKDYLLQEGTDLKYGAWHLKRAIERLLVQPTSNLIATNQVRGGDWVRVEFDQEAHGRRFARKPKVSPFPWMRIQTARSWRKSKCSCRTKRRCMENAQGAA